MIIKTYGQKALEIKPIIENHLNKIIENIKSFTSLVILDNLTIEICDPTSPECPSEIKKYAGLTWSHLNLIQLNTTVFQYPENFDKYYSNILSHEFGHYWASRVGFNIDSSELRQIWNNLRGDKEASIIISGELIAEDFRILFGSNGANGFERGNYTQATRAPKLKSLMKIFPTFTEYKNSLINQVRKIYSVEIISNPNDSDYFALMIIDKHDYFFWDFQHYFIDSNAFYKYDYSLKKWNVIKYL